MSPILIAILLGIVEGVTEFLPVSSTGHLMLATELLGASAEQWKVFNIIIQLGAILAVVVLYWRTFWAVGMGLLKWEAHSVRFVRNLLIAFLPSVVIGLAAKDYIDQMLGTPLIVPVTLILGGIAILMIEKNVQPSDTRGIADISLKKVIGVGFAQCLAMIPGVSRSGATIMGALAMGIERRTAAEFSFFLAIPTMLGASTLEILDNKEAIASGSMGVGWTEIAIGFVVSFVVAMAVIKAFVAFVSKSGFSPFAWYRIVAGAAALIWLMNR